MAKKTTEVIDNLFLTCGINAKNAQLLQLYKITHVLTVAREIDISKLASHLMINYKQIPAEDEDNYPLSMYFDEIADFIHEGLKNNGRVLVHCAYGASRSPTAILAYLIKFKKMKFEEALEMMKDKRSVVDPNPGFIEQLEKYQQACLALSSENKEEIKTETSDKKTTMENHLEAENGIKSTKNEVMEEFKVEKTDAVETKASFKDGNNEEKTDMEKNGTCQKGKEEKNIKNTVSLEEKNKQKAKETNHMEGKEKKTYRCKSCRREMFNEQEMIHGESKGCTSYFLRRFEGMEGKLYCLNKECKEKIGELKLSGAKCSCGEWIVPGYRLTKSKVDNVV